MDCSIRVLAEVLMCIVAVNVIINDQGVFYGQCSEIYGANRSITLLA